MLLYESFWVKEILLKRIPDYQPLYRYKNLFHHTVILNCISFYASSSHLLPPIANITALYLVLVLVTGPELRGHQIFRPLTFL